MTLALFVIKPLIKSQMTLLFWGAVVLDGLSSSLLLSLLVASSVWALFWRLINFGLASFMKISTNESSPPPTSISFDSGSPRLETRFCILASFNRGFSGLYTSSAACIAFPCAGFTGCELNKATWNRIIYARLLPFISFYGGAECRICGRNKRVVKKLGKILNMRQFFVNCIVWWPIRRCRVSAKTVFRKCHRGSWKFVQSLPRYRDPQDRCQSFSSYNAVKYPEGMR